MNSTSDTNPAAVPLGMLDRLDEPTAGRIAATLGMDRFEVVAGPRTAPISVPVTDAFGGDPRLEEVLVTQAVVQAGGVRGWGMGVGEVPQRAMLKAILDALARAGDVPSLQRAAFLLGVEQSRLQAERRQTAELAVQGALRLIWSSRV